MFNRGILRRIKNYLQRNGYSYSKTPNATSSALTKLSALPNRAWPAFGILRGLYFDRQFDRKFNVNTCGAIYLRDLDIESKHVQDGELYDPFPTGQFHRLLSYLPLTDFQEWTLIDFGSGKGRIPLVASEYSFHKIIGIEFSQELHNQAEENLASYRNPKRKSTNIHCLHQDATLFDIPKGNCLFYIFASFR